MLTIGSYCKGTCVSNFTYNGLYLKIKTVKIHKIVVLKVGVYIYIYINWLFHSIGTSNRDVHIGDD